jgi:hypothetical protein
MNNNILEPIIEILQNEGASEDDIVHTISEIIETSSGILFAKVLEVLTDEDLQAIENCTSDEEADALIIRLYSDKVGATPQELMDIFYKEYVTTFINEHSKRMNLQF